MPQFQPCLDKTRATLAVRARLPCARLSRIILFLFAQSCLLLLAPRHGIWVHCSVCQFVRVNIFLADSFSSKPFKRKGLGDEGLADDLREGLQNLELAIGLGFTNVNILGAMMIGLDGNLAAGTLEADIT